MKPGFATFAAIVMTSMIYSVGAEAAGVRDPGVNARQHRQTHRITQGVRSGELTRAEARDLAAEKRSIRKQERAYKSDGKLTVAERKDMHKDLNQASKHIYQEKHDAEIR
jgi:hypothetical protein